MRREILRPAQRKALQAASHYGAIYRCGFSNRHRGKDVLFAGVTIWALLAADQLADDDLGGFVITPQGRARLAREAGA